MSTGPRVIVSAGGGGVGKTTSSAAVALALAETGRRTLIVTVDPARRLAQAMGIDIGSDVGLVRGAGGGKLWALMPDPALSSGHFLELLFEGNTVIQERVAKNPVYAALSSGLAGMHEVVSLMLVARAIQSQEFDEVVVDTAPSRYALDFVSYPGRLANLFEGKAVAWFSELAPKGKGQDAREEPESGGLFAWGKKKAEALVGKVLGPETADSITQLFGDLATSRERFATLARVAEGLLLGENARYLLIAAPTGSAKADVEFLISHLAELGHKPHAMVVNRADAAVPLWLSRVADSADLPPSLKDAVHMAHRERQTMVESADALVATLRARDSGARFVRLPVVDSRDPAAIVRTLADAIKPRLAMLDKR